LTGRPPVDTPRLRILVVNWQDRENPQAGGAEVHLHETFGRLAGWGHEVTLLASGWSGCAPEATLDGIAVHRTGGRHTFSLAAPRYFRRKLAGHGYDVVVEDLNKVPLFTPFWCRAPVTLLVHHLFGTTAFREASFPLAAATWLLERPVPRVFRDAPVVAVSQSTKDDLVRRGLAPEAIEVIPNGIDLAHFTPDPGVARTGRPTLLYLGRLKRYKRVDLIVEAVAELVSESEDLLLRIAGTGDDRPRLERLVARLGLADHVTFLGFVSEDRKLELLRTSWLHTLTSPNEGWGISNMEAAACSTPTVASDAPGLRESVVAGETGLLVPHGNTHALAGAIRRLVHDPEGRAAMGTAARSFAERFSWDASARATASLLGRVVARSRPG
jgi:glycosyltransferase involved in cell wall biosynthesis